jgi:tetratricopeptide (TPR) repeat protein
MLLELEYLAWGLDPRGYHLVSLILHAADAVLFYAVIRTLVARAVPAGNGSRSWVAIPLMSGLSAAIFAVHPLRVEVVAWASCQPYLPSAGLALLSVLAYVRGCAGGSSRAGWRWASVGLYTLALGFKAAPVGLPLVLLILDLSVLERRGAGRSLLRLLVEKIPFLLPAIAASWMAIHAKAPPPPPRTATGGLMGAAAQRSAAAAYGLVYYMEKTAWPRDLSAYHFRPDPIEPAALPFAGRLAAVVALGVAAYLLGRRWPGILAALLSYAILQTPNLGLVPHGLMLVADRYAYAATMPLFVLAAGWLVRCVKLSRKPTTTTAVIAIGGLGLIAVLAGMSWSLCRTWRDSFALWTHALEIGSGHDAMLESNLGIELFDAGRVREGMNHLQKAVEIDPTDADARENLGVALLKQGDESGAIAQMAEAVRLAPGRSDFHHRLGLALAGRGRLEEAVDRLREAIRLRPGHADYHSSLGHVLVDLQRRDEAIAEFTRALLLVPDHPGAWSGLERLRIGAQPTP